MLYLHEQAKAVAQMAVNATIEQYGEDHSAFLFCGFGWVTIKPARGPFINALKKAGIGSKSEYGGWRISNYDIFNLPPKLSQSMELKEIGAQAYANFLSNHGIHAYAQSRAD